MFVTSFFVFTCFVKSFDTIVIGYCCLSLRIDLRHLCGKHCCHLMTVKWLNISTALVRGWCKSITYSDDIHGWVVMKLNDDEDYGESSDNEIRINILMKRLVWLLNFGLVFNQYEKILIGKQRCCCFNSNYVRIQWQLLPIFISFMNIRVIYQNSNHRFLTNRIGFSAL